MRTLFFLLFASTLFAETPVLRINSGGPTVTDPNGSVWLADKYFLSGLTYAVGATTVPANASQVYKDVRHGSFQYNIPVPNGKYRVVLHFSEVFPNYPSRTFDVVANGVRAFGAVNVYVDAGNAAYVPITKTFNVEATNLNGIELKFNPITKSAIVNAIEVYNDVVKPDEWCPSPALSRYDEKTIIIGPNWSESNPCYLNFNVIPPYNRDPINAQRITAPVIVRLDQMSDLSTDLYVWATAPVWGQPITPTKLVIGGKTLTGIVCQSNSTTACSTQTMTEPMFPQNTAPIGTISVMGGQFAAKTNNIMDGNRQITVGPGAAMSLTVADGVLFAQLNPIAQQTFMNQQRIQDSYAQMEVAKNNAIRDVLKQAPPPVQQLKDLEAQMKSLYQEWYQVRNAVPINKIDMDQMKKEFESLRSEMQNARMNERHYSSSYGMYGMQQQMMDQVRHMTHQAVYDAVQQNMFVLRTEVPSDPKQPCQPNQWAEDKVYRYLCGADGMWKRYKVESDWVIPKPPPAALKSSVKSPVKSTAKPAVKK